MRNIFNNRQLAINSDNNFIFFHLDEHNRINYSLYDNLYNFIKTFAINLERVINYSITIDKEDKIHLIALTETGKLNYLIYKNNSWSSTTIAKFHLKSAIYKDLDIEISNNNIHIIYNYSNIMNSNLWTIQHVINHENHWIKYNVINYLGDINSTYFSFDFNTFGILHLMYTSINKGSSEVYHKSFNPFSKKWVSPPQPISYSNNNKECPYIFADTKNNLHGLWLETINNTKVLKYFKLNPHKQGQFKWEEKQIPHISNCNKLPIIFEEKNILKLIYIRDKEISYLYSTDYGNTWLKGNTEKVKPKNIHLLKVNNNSKKYRNLKINHLYYSINEEKPIFHFVETFNNKSMKTYNNNKISVDNKIKIEANISNILIKQKEIKDTLSKLEKNQKEIKDKIDKLINISSIEKKSFFKKLFKMR